MLPAARGRGKGRAPSIPTAAAYAQTFWRDSASVRPTADRDLAPRPAYTIQAPRQRENVARADQPARRRRSRDSSTLG
jgi:hypothetical protein